MKKEMSSFILKCEYNGRYFICNRNESWVNRLANSAVVDWWEIEASPFLSSCNVQVLEEIPDCSNKDLKNQKLLNNIKNEYKLLDPDINEDEHICDIVIGKEISNMRKRMKAKMNELLRLESVAVKYGHKEEFEGIILKNPHHDDWLSLPRYKYPSFQKSGINNKYLYAYLIVNKGSIKARLEEEDYRKKMLPIAVESLCDEIDKVYEGLDQSQIKGYDVVRIDQLKSLIFDVDQKSKNRLMDPGIDEIMKNYRIEYIEWSRDDRYLDVFYCDKEDKDSGCCSAELNLNKFAELHADTLIKWCENK